VRTPAQHNARVSSERWTDVDRYIESRLVPPDPALAAALADSSSAGLPPIHVAPNLGKLLHLLARALGARSILEIGTLGGYSTIWLARALGEGGRLVTIEVDPEHARVAAANLRRAGVERVVELRVGRALDELPKLHAEGRGPFDFVFIDADKPGNAAYFDWAVRLARPGALVVVDNVVRKGEVAVAESGDPNVQGTRALFDAVTTDTRVDATAVQTVGLKGYDGFLIAVVGAP